MRLFLDAVHDFLFARVARHRLRNAPCRIYFHHIPKTGGTSLSQTFLDAAARAPAESCAQAGPGLLLRLLPTSRGTDDSDGLWNQLWGAHRHRLLVNGLVFQVGDQRRIEKGDYYFACSHIPAHQLALPPGTFTLTALRDPVERLLSHYRMLLSHRAREGNSPHYQRILGNSFADFLERRPRHQLLAQLYHFSRTYDVGESEAAIRRCNFWFFLDNMDKAARLLAPQVGLDLRPLWANRSTHRPRLADEQIAAARHFLAPEIALYEALRAPLAGGVAPRYRSAAGA